MTEAARHYVGGDWRVSGEVRPTVDVYSGRAFGAYHAADEAVAEEAIRVARLAFDRTNWAHAPRLRAQVLHELADAIAARQGAIARAIAAENGMSAEVEAQLAASIAQTQSILVNDDPGADLIAGYFSANTLFHETIMTHCGNELIAHTYERIAMLPLAAIGTVAFDQASDRHERLRLTVGHSQHVIIFDAIKKRDGQRAEAMMREHSLATVNYTDLFAKAGDEVGRAAE